MDMCRFFANLVAIYYKLHVDPVIMLENGDDFELIGPMYIGYPNDEREKVSLASRTTLPHVFLSSK